ncbi:LexA family protein [Henriciella aquimarina]|uniref:LexA family protein n=1 Tax=Henriciella aquimarina TaxID=545261 RepID=UPI0009FDCBBE|nr:hypothetical protein [Henriciella aquimarina]
MSLTPRQKDCLLALQAHYDAHGVMPSIRELADRLGYPGKKRPHEMLVALEERGFIRRLPARARAIEILKRIPSESPARCWRWDGPERGPQIGDAVIIEARPESIHAPTPLKDVS